MRILFFLLAGFFSLHAFGQLDRIREMKVITQPDTATAGIRFFKPQLALNAPNVEISYEPSDGNAILYHPTTGFTFQDVRRGQISVYSFIKNKESKALTLTRVSFSYQKGGQTITRDINIPDSTPFVIQPGAIGRWQNERPYHEPGDVIYLEAPFPSSITIRYTFKDFPGRVTVTSPLKAFTTAFALPFKHTDLGTDELWTSYSMHGGGGQVFAYDMIVEGYHNNGWSGLKPNTNNSRNGDHRVDGKPIYAMADGTVIHFLNNCDNNPRPFPGGMTKEQSDSLAKWQMDSLWGKHTHGGAGNHFYIRHGDHVALYAHMRKGSLNPKLLQNGATVKKGDFLGLAGNSGSSSGPHLHVHLYTYKNDNQPEGGRYRPLIFNEGFVIGRNDYPKPMSNVNWAPLSNRGIPGLKERSAFIWPSDTHLYCAYPKNRSELALHGLDAAKFQEEFDKMYTCGYYPIWIDGFEVGGKLYYNLLMRPSTGQNWVARHSMSKSGFDTEKAKWEKEGYKLLNVNSYRVGNNIRHAAVWVKDNRNVMAYHERPLSWHEANFTKHMNEGWVPVNVSVVPMGNENWVSALWEKKNVGGFYARPMMTLQQYKDYFKDYTDKQGFKLVYLDGFVLNGKPMLSGIWHKNAPNHSSWAAKHYLTGSGYQTEWNSYTGSGHKTTVVTGYADGNTARFEGIWAK